MIRSQHYLKSAFKNFKRNKGYTALMVISLAVGMFCFILASAYVSFEYSRNSSHEYADRIYEVKLKLKRNGRGTELPEAFAAGLKELNPDIESVNLLDNGPTVFLSADGQDHVEEKHVYYSDNELFNIFSFPLKYGSRISALGDVGKVVISNRLSELLFNGKNPVGEELIVHGKGTFIVSGVLEELSAKTLLYPGLLFSRAQLHVDRPGEVSPYPLLTHIKIAEETDIEAVEESIFSGFQGDLVQNQEVDGILTEKLSDAYWGISKHNYATNHYSLTGSNKSMIKTIGYVSLGVLLCAFVGYLSLSLGMSLRRAKEIGIRKANGARKSDIRLQLLSESVFYALLSLLITIIALELFSPYFSRLFKIPIGLEYNEPFVLIGLVLFAVSTGLLAGAYPAFVVSKLNPVHVLSGFNSKLGIGFKLRQGLLVTQFIITISLIFCVFSQQLQVREMLGFDFGFKKEGILAFSTRNEHIKGNFEAILDEIRGVEGVTDVSGGPFPYSFNGSRQFILDRGDTLLKSYIPRIWVQDNFFEVMDVDLWRGSSFLAANIPLNTACIINRPFAKVLGENALGMTITYDNEPKTVVGIVDQYVDLGINHFGSDPRIFLVNKQAAYHSFLVEHDPTQTASVSARLEDIWRSYESVVPPVVTNLSENTDHATASLRDSTRLYTFLAITLLSLSLLNLLGVSLSFALGEVKNISIRRILGAETLELFFRLLRPFLTALAIGLVIAIPIGYWLMEQYLNDYAVRIKLTAVHGLTVSMMMFVMLVLIIGYQMLRFSRIDPVDTLKDQ